MKSFGLNTFLAVLLSMTSAGPLFAKIAQIPKIGVNVFNSFDNWVEISFTSKSGSCNRSPIKLASGRGTIFYFEVGQCSDVILHATELYNPNPFSTQLALSKLFGYNTTNFKVTVTPNAKNRSQFFLKLQELS